MLEIRGAEGNKIRKRFNWGGQIATSDFLFLALVDFWKQRLLHIARDYLMHV